MKNVVLALISMFIISSSTAQKIVNLVLVGDSGITEDMKEAKFFILVKENPDGSFARLDYKMHAPLKKMQTYRDSLLQILDGRYLEYYVNGTVSTKGFYSNNLKENDWYYYNDTGKLEFQEKYLHDKLVEAINPDTLPKTINKKLAPGEKDATFAGGDKGWLNYVEHNLNPDVAINSVQGGTVIVNFTINKSGKPEQVYLDKSVEFVLDEEALRVIYNSPRWTPAVQDGHTVNAYRRQPLTFVVTVD